MITRRDFLSRSIAAFGGAVIATSVYANPALAGRGHASGMQLGDRDQLRDGSCDGSGTCDGNPDGQPQNLREKRTGTCTAQNTPRSGSARTAGTPGTRIGQGARMSPRKSTGQNGDRDGTCDGLGPAD